MIHFLNTLTPVILRRRALSVKLFQGDLSRAHDMSGLGSTWFGPSSNRSQAPWPHPHLPAELAKLGVTLPDTNAYAFAAQRETLLRLDQNMMKIEGRRNFALREIKRRRASLGLRLGATINEVEAEFKEVRIEGHPSETKET